MDSERLPRSRDYFVGERDLVRISFEDFVTALNVWAWMSPGIQTTVRQAAETFQVADAVIREAVAQHPWMFVDGPDDEPAKQTIEHDGD